MTSEFPVPSVRDNKFFRIALLLLLSLFAGWFIYKTALIGVILAVLHREGSSHGLFVPFLSGYFLWDKRSIICKIAPAYDFRGFYLLGIAIIPFLFNFGTYHLHYIAFIIFVMGLIYIILGRQICKEMAFSILFLIAMTPMTGEIYGRLADYARHVTFGGSLSIISLLDIPYYRTGWLIELPNALLEVTIGCSGIRYLISYFIFGIAYAYLVRDMTLGRIVVIVSTIPIAMAAGVLRLTAIFAATYYISPMWSEPRPHIFISWVVFFTVLMLSITLDQYIQKRQYAGEAEKPESKDSISHGALRAH